MTTIVGISGSLRQSSFNTSLLRAAAGVVPARTELKAETIGGIPLYDGDVEASEGIPATVAALKDRIAAADGLRTLGTRPWFGGCLLVSRAQTVFDSSGNLTDEGIRKQLQQVMAGFVAFISS
jgi:hypothetical protein